MCHPGPGHATPRHATHRREDSPLPDTPAARSDADGRDNAADQEVVDRDRAEVREFVTGLSADAIKSGNWFTELIAHALGAYTQKMDWHYFQEQYEGVPADVIVDQRIKMASRYAALEGGLSSSTYSAAVIATLGPRGGASPVTLKAALATGTVDAAYISQLQLRLAFDIAVLYQVPIDTADPEDLWKLIRVAFTIRSGSAISAGITKSVPAIVRPVIKRFYAGPALNAAKGLPVVGKYLLQRNAIKIGIPIVGIPLTVVVNRYSTMVSGRHAQAVFRNEARVIELADQLSERSQHPKLTLWVALLVIMADGKATDDEALLIRHLVRFVKERHQVVDEQFARLLDFDPAEVWRRLDSEPGITTELLDVAERVANVDGAANARERRVISELKNRCRRG